MWQPLPQQIVVRANTEVKSDAFGSRRAILPAGTYTLWRTNENGPLYRSAQGTAHVVEFLKRDSDLPAGIMLYNKANVALVVAIETEKANPWKSGELAAYVINKDIEKNGYSYWVLGQLTGDQREELGLPRKNHAP